MTQAEILGKQGYITASEAAGKLGRHITSVYRLVQTGALEGVHIGRSWYVKSESIIGYANKECPNGAALLGLVPAKRAR